MLATLTNFAFFLAQATAPAAASDTAPASAPASAPAQGGGGGLFGGGMGGWVPILLLVAAMYFLLFAPQRKKQKEMQKMLAEIDTGAEVMTSSGIFGTIANKKDDRFVLRIADGVKIEIHKSAVQTVIKKSGQDAKS